LFLIQPSYFLTHLTQIYFLAIEDGDGIKPRASARGSVDNRFRAIEDSDSRFAFWQSVARFTGLAFLVTLLIPALTHGALL
jgi:hypothetical protein